jgi:peptidoglycan hydrolase-like protein with peptidoglycan-binding domain
MGIPFIGAVIDTIGEAIDTVADKIAPDQNVKIQSAADLQKFKLQLKAGLQTEIIQKALSEKGFLLKDLEGARNQEVELAKMEPPAVRYITGLLRGIFRPVIGFATIGSYVWSQFLAPYWDFQQLTLSPYAHGFVGIVVTFYFGGRTMEKIKNPQGISRPLVQTVKFAPPQGGVVAS